MKRKKKITVTRWAIVGQSNSPMEIAHTRSDAIRGFCGHPEAPGYKPWPYWRKLGVRAVKVQVSFEIEGG